VTTAARSVSVTIDGGSKLTATVAPPPTALVAFTAATGDGTDAQTVTNVQLAETASAPILGAGGQCMDVKGGKALDNTPVQFYTCNGTASQLWTPTAAGAVQALGKCLQVKGGRTAAGSPIVLSTCAGTPPQHWLVLPDGELWNPKAGRCAGSSSGTSANGTALALADCTAVATEIWALGSVRALPVPTSTTGTVVGAGGTCLTVRGSSASSGTPVEIDGCNRSTAQSWTFAADRTVRALGMCLDIAPPVGALGSPIQIKTCAGTSTQSWVRLTDGELLNPGTRHCLTIPGDVSTSGTAVVTGACTASTGRRWAFPK
jgi:hypothetical protein